ncbi:MAG TPA: DoxX family protein [Planctomycetota bacterium]|jgi:putative oxidoreductase|nr:DoxX family protein [Planctomycetota bacterium]
MSSLTKDKATSAGLLVLRLFLGLGLAAHGYQKVFLFGINGFAGLLEKLGTPLPQASAWLSASTELAGGLLIALGLFTRPAAVSLAINMAVAAFLAHSGYFITNTPPGREYAVNLAAAFVALALTGAGQYSLDHRLARRPENS